MQVSTQSKEKTNKAIVRAIESADNKSENWSIDAYNFLLKYAKDNHFFFAKDVRIASRDIIEEPPSQRAWGYIFRKAKEEKILKSSGVSYVEYESKVSNNTYAMRWRSLIYNKK